MLIGMREEVRKDGRRGGSVLISKVYRSFGSGRLRRSLEIGSLVVSMRLVLILSNRGESEREGVGGRAPWLVAPAWCVMRSCNEGMREKLDYDVKD